MPRVKTVMTPFPFSIQPETTVERAREIMLENKIRHLPIVEHGKPKSIVSDRDISLALAVFPEDAATELRVADICPSDLYTVDLETPLDVVALALAERHIGAAIVTKEDRLAGIFTALDACRALGEHLQNLFRDTIDDIAG
ncbi:MAG: CBS domain-containing protein [Bdellovibrionales bacterium]|nr:CBS domain-containing protein [Bdellovibrionales bacterium]